MNRSCECTLNYTFDVYVSMYKKWININKRFKIKNLSKSNAKHVFQN